MASTSAGELYRRWLDELWNGGPEAVPQLVTDDFVGHWPDGDVIGPVELATLIRETQEMFSELRFVLDVGPIVQDDFVCARWTGRGQTPEGPLTFFGNDILRVRDDRITEYWPASSVGAG